MLWTFQPQLGNARAFVTYDANGNVSTLVYCSDGQSVGQYEYGPFGEVIRATGPMAKANPFRFSTKYQDDETDLLYYGYRYYSASTGRWLSRDPLGDKGFRRLGRPLGLNSDKADLNLMAMGFNDPIGRYDVLGLLVPQDSGYQSHCCPELGFWTPCSEICRMALRDPKVATKIKGGGVVCYHGKACGCLAWEPNSGYSPGECPEIDSIIQYHEDQHAPKTDCSKCGFYRADKWKPGVDDDTEECEQRKENIKRLDSVKDQLSEKCAAVAEKLLKKLKEDTAKCP